MQKFLNLQLAVLLVVLLSGARVEAFAVAMTHLALTGDFEAGGLHEIGVICLVGDNPSVVEVLPEVAVPGVLYELNPFVIIDENLGPTEVHQCLIVELDEFESGDYNDVDREDRMDDAVCAFTIQRTDFHVEIENASIKEGDYCVVGLVCADC